jgi:hypothetical protein
MTSTVNYPLEALYVVRFVMDVERLERTLKSMNADDSRAVVPFFGVCLGAYFKEIIFCFTPGEDENFFPGETPDVRLLRLDYEKAVYEQAKAMLAKGGTIRKSENLEKLFKRLHEPANNKRMN